ncbi:MSMB protein, partial [Rhynochetos jubatus]|nr:MSMB protein [Rhynochetos jubatus]
CRDMNGKLHEFDSRWRSDACYDCSCTREGIGCCASFKTPTGYNKKKCVRIFNKDTCTYKVVKKDNHSEECSVYKWVG